MPATIPYASARVSPCASAGTVPSGATASHVWGAGPGLHPQAIDTSSGEQPRRRVGPLLYGERLRSGCVHHEGSSDRAGVGLVLGLQRGCRLALPGVRDEVFAVQLARPAHDEPAYRRAVGLLGSPVRLYRVLQLAYVADRERPGRQRLLLAGRSHPGLAAEVAELAQTVQERVERG